MVCAADGEAADATASSQRRARRLARRLRALGRRAGGAGRGLPSSARRSWWWRCSACSRPAAPTCRSIRPIPRERLAFDAGGRRRRQRVRCSPRSGCAALEAALGGLDAPPVHLLCLDAGWRGLDEPPEDAAPGRGRPGQPRLRDLHLGLDRPAQGGGDRRTAAPPPCSRWARDALLRRRSWPASSPRPRSASTSRSSSSSCRSPGGGTVVLARRRPGARRQPAGAARGDAGQHRPLGDGRAGARWGRCRRRCARSTWPASRCAAPLARRLYALPHVERVLNLYGPSEDTTYSTVAAGAAARRRAADRPAGRRHPRPTCWTAGAGRCRSGCRASCCSAAPGWPAATSAGRS